MRSLGLWNDLLKSVCPLPDVVCPEPNQEALSTAFHVVRNAFLELSSATGSLLTRRDMYWDAMEVVRRQLTRG